MKRIKIVVAGLALIMVSSCSSESEEKELTYEERVKEVCDCFSDSESPSDCFMLQAEHIKHLPEDKVIEFTQETNNCAN